MSGIYFLRQEFFLDGTGVVEVGLHRLAGSLRVTRGDLFDD
jgi:hypothetical protein